MTLTNRPTLTPDQAFDVIYFLQDDRELKLIPDHFEKCDWCDCLYDSHREGHTVEEYTFWYEDMDIPKSLVDENEGARFCSSECEYKFFEESTLGRLLLGCGYTDKWPDKPGLYWFYGWTEGDTKSKPEFLLVEVFRGEVVRLIFTDGVSHAPKSDITGIWKPVDIQMPSAEAMKELLKNRKEKE